ncbi:ferric-dicitrate binding protein FerR, regulates iron transport through sigma-19 [Pseudarcicella hirudinis]|uniref:Ferric-dicitrate binding protein FerR, regulates iron transport through sigma-19 n=1 Tax=Pseudarcicella hirudinis TaxID=1079859 RepID=A0A1I5VWD0_9BACT|nr:FecR domain-containing protein [Pseudarcicella hirudinis]SFQ11785.1 ferric-dicitrate binding protein FerR, regulates iron transport through sigma-19 [Pseudarcicella hirudinis]
MQKNIDPDLLKRYLENSLNPEEKEKVELWYESLPGDEDSWSKLSPQQKDTFQVETWENINQHIELPGSGKVISFRPSWLRTGMIAASVLIILGVLGVLWQKREKVFSQESAVAEISDNWKVFTNTQNKIVRHNFSDGSAVWLHPNTEVRFPVRFSGKQRKIIFRGEGFFEIAKDRQHPFIIQTDKIQIAVLGTSFTVKSRTKNSPVEVSVVTGKVSVKVMEESVNKSSAILTAGQSVAYNPQTTLLTVNKNIIKENKQTLYQPVTISFDNSRLEDVIKQLEEKFDTKITLINAQIANCRITADFDQENLLLILDIISETTNLSYSLENNQVELSGPGCN